MRKQFFCLSAVAMAMATVISLVACRKIDGNAQGSSVATTLSLRDFTPPALASTWQCFGAIDYSVTYTLQSSVREGEDTRYTVLAAVDDLSDGESGRGADYFNVHLRYILTKDVMVQEGQRAPMMDAEFQKLELLRMPLQQGARWSQEQRDALGELVTIDCQITNLTTNEGNTTIDVTYISRDGKRHERRRFESGKGMTLYEKLWEMEFPIGFHLKDGRL